MKAKEIDFTKLNEAVERFGSLQKANARLEKEGLTLEKENNQLKQENDELSLTSRRLASQIEDMSRKIEDRDSRLQSLYSEINVRSYQYELFCGFMAMVAESPSVTDSIEILIAVFQKLRDPGWSLPKSADDMRSLFVLVVMGDYLKCFRCDSCGAKFITNKEPQGKYFGNGCQCPVCHSWYAVGEDDSFLKALVSEKQLEDTLQLERVLREIETLKAFKAFLNAPCEMCHEPIKEWDDYDVELAFQGVGCGHTHCWKSELGRLRQLAKTIQKVKQDTPS